MPEGLHGGRCRGPVGQNSVSSCTKPIRHPPPARRSFSRREESRCFLDGLDRPFRPNARLKKAMEEAENLLKPLKR